MALVKISAVDLEYPLVGFIRQEGLLFFDDLALLTSADPGYVSDDTFIGMELIDNRRRRWIVRSLLLEKPIPKKRWWQLSHPHVRFDLELEEMDPISLEELKARLVVEWEEFPEDVEILRSAPDLATIVQETNTQTSGLL